MARKYPRFIYQHVTEGKTSGEYLGEYIVHTLEPMAILKKMDNAWILQNVVVESKKRTIEEVIADAGKWYQFSVLKKG